MNQQSFNSGNGKLYTLATAKGAIICHSIKCLDLSYLHLFRATNLYSSDVTAEVIICYPTYFNVAKHAGFQVPGNMRKPGDS